MILGTGVDLVSLARFERFRQRHRERGLRRIFTAAELEYCLRRAAATPSLAARFAAKEAFFKALGTGFGKGGRWTEVEIARASSGQPLMRLHGRAAEVAQSRRVRHIHLSLSHTAEAAVAVVILEA